MRRREFIALIGGAAMSTPSIGVRAQGAKTLRLGYLSPAGPPDVNLESFRAGMRDIGYAEGRDYTLELRYAGRDYSRFPSLVHELLAAKVDLIITGGASTRAAPFAAQSVPVVFAFSGDPVDAGIVASLARPGGNATGVSMLQLDLAAKRVELIKEIAPAITRVAVLANPDHPGVLSEHKATREAARKLGLGLELFEPTSDENIAAVLESFTQSNVDAVLTFPDALTLFHRDKIAAASVRRQAPSVFGWKSYTQAGGLLSYGPVQAEPFARLAYFVDRIAKGAKPAELPVERPAKLELVINLKAAKALGLTIPPTLLARADEVIE
ncbi:MAG: transporter substrate-binding protein [Microvirga sp.]|jgi:putative ABC transport system substrate-binding protein|nr:transporter substrate-binding protein [Microvirga sp.]